MIGLYHSVYIYIYAMLTCHTVALYAWSALIQDARQICDDVYYCQDWVAPWENVYLTKTLHLFPYAFLPPYFFASLPFCLLVFLPFCLLTFLPPYLLASLPFCLIVFLPFCLLAFLPPYLLAFLPPKPYFLKTL